MNYQELIDVLRNRNAAYSNMQPTSIQAPTLEQVISGIQSQYQQPAMQSMIPQAQAGQSYGAARFTGGPQTFSQQEFTPAVSSAPQFVPGAFDLNKYTTKTDANDIANMIQSYSGDTGGGTGSPLSNGNVENWGNPLSLGTIGKGAMAVMSMSPISAISAFLSGKQDMTNGTYGTTTTNPDGSKTISGQIQGQPFSYTEAPSSGYSSESISSQSSEGSEPGGYGTGETSGGFGEGQY